MNFLSSEKVHAFGNDATWESFYIGNMAKTVGPDWFLVQWMRTLRINQAELIKRLDWPKSKMSMLFNGKRNYNREMLNAVSSALHIEPFELLLDPERAMAIRRMHDDAVRIAADRRLDYVAAPGDGTFGR